jgi:hypothetical protein
VARRTPAFLQVTTSTTGFGPYTLTNTVPAATGYRSIADCVTDGSLVSGDEILFCIYNKTAAPTGKMFEYGRGTLNTSTLVLTVVTIYERSATLTSGGGWGAGVKDVFIASPGSELAAMIDLANVFTADQVIEKANPTLSFREGGVTRYRQIYSGSTGTAQYFSALAVIRGSMYMQDAGAGIQHFNTSGVLDGGLEVGAGTLTFNDGVATKNVARLDSGKTVAQLDSGMKVVQLAGGNVNKVPWYQATAPTGWVKDTSQNDKAMRIVSGGTGGTAGGSMALSSSKVGGTSLSIAQLAAHAHSFDLLIASGPIAGGGSPGRIVATAQVTDPKNTSSEGSGAAHDHDLSLAYIDLIIASLT